MWILLAACRRDDEPGPGTSPEPVTTEVCAAAGARAEPGDANGDGSVDVADVVALREHVFFRADPPACPEAVDLVGDGTLMSDDTWSLLLHVYEGEFDLPGSSLPCEGRGAPPRVCADLGWSVVADGGGRARVRLNGSAVVQGWSLSVTPTGCRVVDATTDGTAGASVWVDPAGRRDTGYDATFLANRGGATSAVVLSLTDDVGFELGDDGVDVLALGLEADGGCSCSLAIDTPLKSRGDPVRGVVVVDSAALRPAPMTAIVDACR